MNKLDFSDALLEELQTLFASLPGAYVLLSLSLRVEAVSAGYWATAPDTWPTLQPGQHLPTALASALGQCPVRKLCASLAHVLLTGQAHTVASCPTCKATPSALTTSAQAGSPRTWQFHNQLVRDKQGAERHILCQLQVEGTPFQAAYAQLPMAASYLASVKPALPNPADLLAQIPTVLGLLLGPTHVVALCNPLASQVWGQPAAHLLGRPFLETLPAAAVARYAAACATAWQSEQPVVWPEMPVAGVATAASAPELYYVALSFQPFRSPTGEVIGLLLVVQDVTPLLQARQQVLQARAELAATNAGLADYVSESMRTAAGAMQR